MKIRLSQLRKIIKEEVGRALGEVHEDPLETLRTMYNYQSSTYRDPALAMAAAIKMTHDVPGKDEALETLMAEEGVSVEDLETAKEDLENLKPSARNVPVGRDKGPLGRLAPTHTRSGSARDIPLHRR